MQNHIFRPTLFSAYLSWNTFELQNIKFYKYLGINLEEFSKDQHDYKYDNLVMSIFCRGWW